MKELIEENIKYISKLTKEESDFILHVLKWNDEQMVAFKWAKKIFDEGLDADKRETK